MKIIDEHETHLIIDDLVREDFEKANERTKGETSFLVRYVDATGYISGFQQDKFDRVIKNAETCMYEDKYTDNKLLMTICNHILLEAPRIKELKQISQLSTRANNSIRQAKSEQSKMSSILKDFDGKMSKMQGEFITILSIFAAVIIAFLGGINTLGGVLNNINATNKYRLIFIVLMIGLILFNVIYMLFYAISKLTEKHISKRKKKCNECENSIGYMCLKEKHPLLYYNNLFYILFLYLVVVVNTIDNYNIPSWIILRFKFQLDNIQVLIPSLASLIIGIISIISFGIFKIVIWIMKKVSVCNNPNNNNSNNNNPNNNIDNSAGEESVLG